MKKYRVCLGNREYKLAGTQSTRKHLVRANEKSRLRHIESPVLCRGWGECLVHTSLNSEELLNT